MRKILTISALLTLFLISYFSINSRPTGAPAAASGGPAESNITCSQSGCHSGSPSLVTTYLKTDIPASGYVPGRIYNVFVNDSVAGTNTLKKGFQVSPQDSVGHKVGTLIIGSGTQVNTFSNVGYITHTSAKTTNPAKWSFQWQAPARGTGRFSFYGAFAISTTSTKRQSILISENKTLPVVTSKPAAPIESNIAVINGQANAKSGVYNVSFQYKKEGGTWTFINGTPANIAGDSDVNFQIPVPGLIPGAKYIYRACAWNKGDTTWADSVSFTTNLTGIEEVKSITNVEVYPQPATTDLYLNFQLQKAAQVEVAIYGLNGELVQKVPFGKLTSGGQQLSFPLSLSKGIYLIQMKANEEVYMKKILVQ